MKNFKNTIVLAIIGALCFGGCATGEFVRVKNALKTFAGVELYFDTFPVTSKRRQMSAGKEIQIKTMGEAIFRIQVSYLGQTLVKGANVNKEVKSIEVAPSGTKITYTDETSE